MKMPFALPLRTEPMPRDHPVHHYLGRGTLFLGGALLVAGAVLPWGIGAPMVSERAVSGLDVGGQITLLFGIAVFVLSLTPNVAVSYFVSLPAGVLSLGFGLKYARTIGYAPVFEGAITHVSPGVGLETTLLGSTLVILVAAGGVLAVVFPTRKLRSVIAS